MKPKNITLKKGNMFDTECEVIVNTVNCAGIMGKGIALEAKNRFPEMYKDYKITKTATGMWKLSRQGKSLFEYNLRASERLKLEELD